VPIRARPISIGLFVIGFLFLDFSLFCLIRILTLPNFFIWIHNQGLTSSTGIAYIYINAKLYIFQYSHYVSFRSQLFSGIEGCVIFSFAGLLAYPFRRLKNQAVIGFLIKPIKITRTPLSKATSPVKKLATFWPFKEAGIGSLFIVGFIALLALSAIYLSLGNAGTANNLSIYAFYSLVIGVVLQIASYLRYGEDKEESQEEQIIRDS